MVCTKFIAVLSCKGHLYITVESVGSFTCFNLGDFCCISALSKSFLLHSQSRNIWHWSSCITIYSDLICRIHKITRIIGPQCWYLQYTLCGKSLLFNFLPFFLTFLTNKNRYPKIEIDSLVVRITRTRNICLRFSSGYLIFPCYC